MNLRGIANSVTRAINPNVPGVFQISTGYTTLPSGKPSPSHNSVDVEVQFQELSSTDLRQVDAMNIQGILRSAYLNGNFNGVNRPEQKGGDILIVNNQQWLVVKVAELWPDWCRVIVNLQRST
ncbi:hypothetical protein N5923_23315 [Erwiniaceae bacterium BAC15a-03b]|uniref:Uncharacterized protein n=1 Tax=Winslowiella arboricola TaxID=2978220 RepID=A0A9J6PQ44_9GAMM|nr:hypothetical protein [Winslowiella arboricola]MCU5775121.1 hypothetical protein [Winslowiella arboricola]MCU5780425.1 hypothetical protein [Winslowiella arboricola]